MGSLRVKGNLFFRFEKFSRRLKGELEGRTEDTGTG